MSSHLSGGRLNVALLQEASRKEFLNILQSCEGPKVVIWDEWLAGPIGLVATYSLLQDVDVVNIFSLDRHLTTPPNVKHVIYITRPKLHLLDIVADNVFYASKSNAGPKKEFHLIFVPRKSEFCETRLSTIYGSFTNIFELKCDIFPFDNDLLSLELQNDYRDYHLDGDPTSLYQSAVALRKIQQLYGTIPKVVGQGQAAKQVWDLMCRLTKEEQDIGPKGPEQCSIDTLLLLDRSIDLSSVLATQLNYEGLIDEMFGLNYNATKLPEKKFTSSSEQGVEATKAKDHKLILNSSDELFAELRDQNITAVGAILSRKARLIKDQLGDRHDNKSVQEIKQFVSKLPHLLANKQFLATHTVIAECIKEITDTFEFHDLLECEDEFLNCVDTEKLSTFIEDLIAQKAPLTKVLRLICLQCITGSGLKPKILEYYKRELLQVYGWNTWLSVCNLEKAGILKLQTGSRQYAVLRKALRLTATEPNDKEEQGKSYLASTYTPITVRLAEHLCKNKGWFGIQDILGLFHGFSIEESQSTQNKSRQCDNSSTKVILVFFIGGCTYNEISALRNLSQQDDINVDFIIMTTKLINGNSFVQSMLEKE